MDESVARQRLMAERAEVAQLLKDAESAGVQDREGEDEPGDYADAALPLTAQGMDDASPRACGTGWTRSTARSSGSRAGPTARRCAAEYRSPTSDSTQTPPPS